LINNELVLTLTKNISIYMDTKSLNVEYVFILLNFAFGLLRNFI